MTLRYYTTWAVTNYKRAQFSLIPPIDAYQNSVLIYFDFSTIIRCKEYLHFL